MKIQEMKIALADAEVKKNKTAMLHYLALKHADILMNDDPKELCKMLGLKVSMASEILKMRAVHLLMKSENLKI